MGGGGQGGAKAFVKFLATLFVISVAMVSLGYLPMKRLGGAAGVESMLSGCGVTFVASLVGALPLYWGRALRGPAAAQAPLASMAIRMLVTLMAALAIVFLTSIDRRYFLLWVAASYLLLLIADVSYALMQAPDGH